MIRHALDRLIKLRQLREDRAMDEVAAQEQERLRTQNELDEAIDTLRRYGQLSVERERTKLSSLIGQRLHPSELMNLQSALNASDDHRTRLQENQQQAEANLTVQTEQARKARLFYLFRHRQHEKLKALANIQAAQEKRRQLAITETEDEEAYIRRARSPFDMSRGRGVLRKR